MSSGFQVYWTNFYMFDFRGDDIKSVQHGHNMILEIYVLLRLSCTVLFLFLLACKFSWFKLVQNSKVMLVDGKTS